MNNQSGQALPLAILALCIGSLVVTPFLTYTGTSLVSSATYEQSLAELYSCEAGIEYAIWDLKSGNLIVAENTTADLPHFILNGKTVDITVANTGSQIYLVTSAAIGSDAHSTIIHSYIKFSGGAWTTDGNIAGDTTGEVFVDGNANIGSGINVVGSVYATGDVIIGNNAEITGDVVSQGNLDLSNSATIGGDVTTNGSLILGNNAEIGSIEVGGNVYATGDITLDNNTVIYGDVYTNGNIVMKGNAVIKGDIFIEANGTSIILDNNAIIEGNIYITGNITNIQLASNAHIYLNVYATGDITTITREVNITGDVFIDYTGSYPPPPESQTIPEGGGATIISGN